MLTLLTCLFFISKLPFAALPLLWSRSFSGEGTGLFPGRLRGALDGRGESFGGSGAPSRRSFWGSGGLASKP